MRYKVRSHCLAKATRALRLGLAGFALSTVLVAACQAGTPEDDAYLRGRGPYRGRVTDAATKQPITGAVVLAVWYYDRYALVQTNTAYHDAVEVVTDAQGDFVVDAPEIERRAPRRTRFPIFTIFRPGYLYFRGWFADPEVMAERQRRPLLGVVDLERVAGKGRRQRQENLGVPPGGGVPEAKMPKLLRAYAEELEEMKKEH